MIKEFRKWREERRKKLAFAAGNKDYLLNSLTDKAFFEKCLKVVERENVTITVWLLDGSHIDIKPISNNRKTRRGWQGDE